MTAYEQVIRDLRDLSEPEVREVASFLDFLKFRARKRRDSPLDDPRTSALYAEFAEEDQRLAEEGMGDYAEMLAREDVS